MKRIQLTHPDETAATITEFLMDGGVVAMPMDTSYGIAADATNREAVDAVYALKGREYHQPLSVVVSGREQAGELGQFSPQASRLWDVFMPGMLTLVVPQLDSAGLADNLTGGRSTIGLREPDCALTRLVAERFGKPYTATSANRSGQPPAFSADEFLAQLPDEVVPHLVIDAPPMKIGRSSTVVEVAERVQIIREGMIPAATINEALEG